MLCFCATFINILLSMYLFTEKLNFFYIGLQVVFGLKTIILLKILMCTEANPKMLITLLRLHSVLEKF